MTEEGRGVARPPTPDPDGGGIPGPGDGPETVIIRPMRRRDLVDVMAIEKVAFTTPWTLATFMGLLRRNRARLWVAEANGGVVGYAVVWTVLDQAELGNLAVAPAWRRSGLGTRLLEEVLEAMEASGIREVFLEVRVSNSSAQRLYGRHGFRQVGRRLGYYSNPKEDALVLRRLIRSA